MGSLLVTAAQPVLTGSGFSSSDGPSYDLAAKRWLPVPREQVRNNGLAYAYAEPYFGNGTNAPPTAFRVHVVSLVDNKDRVTYSGDARAVLAYEPEGVYITAIRYGGEGLGTGLWRLDPSTGASTQLPNGSGFEVISQGIAWTDFGSIMPRRLVRLDVSKGTQETWVDTQDHGWIWLVGLDGSGHPLVDVSEGTNGPWRLYVYTAPQVRTAIADLEVHHLSITDSHGTWLSGSDGIYLLLSDGTIAKVSTETGGAAAGSCR